MDELLEQLFAQVCGQDFAHTFVLGGERLPQCQRCSGIYVGAVIAAVLHLVLRQRRNQAYLFLHGIFLLQMVPMGLYWIPQGPILRAVSGLLFGFGLVAWLWLPSASQHQRQARADATARAADHRIRPSYVAALLGSLIALPALATHGGASTHLALSLLSGLGLLVLVLLSIRAVLLLVAAMTSVGSG